MAIIEKFERYQKRTFKTQPTRVTGFYGTFGEGDQKVLQLDTLGSEDREKRQKLSQTIQLERDSAERLWRLLGDEFGFSR